LLDLVRCGPTSSIALWPGEEYLLPYDPEYPTCSYTHVWLRVLDEKLDPDEVTSAIGIEPTNTQRAGDNVAENSQRTRRYSGWFLESAGQVDSRDSREHFDWLLNQLEGKGPCLEAFSRRGYLVDICCRWDSAHGDGGPSFTPSQLSALGALGVELWFDIYFDREKIEEQ
jgi:hypothetical protein